MAVPHLPPLTAHFHCQEGDFEKSLLSDHKVSALHYPNSCFCCPCPLGFHLRPGGPWDGAPVQPPLCAQRSGRSQLPHQRPEARQGVVTQPQQGRLQQVCLFYPRWRSCYLTALKTLPHHRLPPSLCSCPASTTTTGRRGSRYAGSRPSPCSRTTSPPSPTSGPSECWCGRCSVTGSCRTPSSAMMKHWKVSVTLQISTGDILQELRVDFVLRIKNQYSHIHPHLVGL